MKLQRDNIIIANVVVMSLRPLLCPILFYLLVGQQENTYNNNSAYEYMCYNTKKQDTPTFTEKLHSPNKPALSDSYFALHMKMFLWVNWLSVDLVFT